MTPRTRRALIYPALVILYILLLTNSSSFQLTSQQTEFEDAGTIHYFSCHENDCSQLLSALLRESETADCAFYDIDLTLINLSQQGTRALIFDENIPENTSATNIEPVPSKGLMHHKFCVFNNRTVLTGTWNPTVRGTYVNDNSILLIRSPAIASLYQKEYALLESRTDSSLKPAPHPETPYTIRLSNTTVKLSFSPVQPSQELIATTLEKASASVHILAFMFTSDALGDLLVTLTPDVAVKGVFEATGTSRYSEFDKLASSGADLLKDGNPAFMHQKMMIVDSQTLIIGSYNPTKNARERNDENLLVINDSDLASEALRDYARIRSEAEVATREQ